MAYKHDLLRMDRGNRESNYVPALDLFTSGDGFQLPE